MKKSRYLISGLLFLSIVAKAQTDSIGRVIDRQEKSIQNILKDEHRMQHQIKDVIISAYQEESAKHTALSIETISIDSLARTGTFTLTDLMAKTAGITKLSTGVGIAKPVLRGLYGNRLLILMNGLKFDNQQWQDEHGLGLSEMGLSKVEVVKGPMSVLYGSEALGGVLNLIEENKAPINRRLTDFTDKMNTNTFGGSVDYGTRINHRGKNWSRFRLHIDNHADYSDGRNSRVLNSRFDGYALKYSYGFQKEKWTSEWHWASSFNRFGFIFNDIYSFVVEDPRQSRRLSYNPAHLVILNMFSNVNHWKINSKNQFNFNWGVQSNERMEREGSGAISLNMHLLTAQYLAKWEHRLNLKHSLILTHYNQMQSNVNYGARKIIPDARMQEANFSLYWEYNPKEELVFESGISYGEKYIQSLLTVAVNDAKKEIKPFKGVHPFYSFFSGVSYNPTEWLNMKLNIANGIRVPNLAELSSNGLHEGIFIYELGNPNLKNENSIGLNGSIGVDVKQWNVQITPFYTLYKNYIYLAPTNQTWYGFKRYAYEQQDAMQMGGEFLISYKQDNQWEAHLQYAGMQSKTADGNYTPFIPAQKFSSGVQYSVKIAYLPAFVISTSVDHCLAPQGGYVNEILAKQYTLWNAGMSFVWNTPRVNYDISLNGNNLLNTVYFDNLSRFKDYGIYEIGRNIALRVKLSWNQVSEKKHVDKK
ncbi:MAG: TonB-dependent receptor [Chitinophagales bacterium]|nr:TonB-dependent receptor [Chitinophagales bacterium]